MNNKKKTRTIKELTATNRELKKTLSGVRGQLTKTETKLIKANQKADRWKKETAAQRTAASRSDARVEKLQKKLDRAAAALEPVQAVSPLEAAASGLTVGEPTAADGLTVPDETWTVVQLRAEARARGLVGMSKKSKAELLDALS
jgi:chromosome segregation ATPase